MLPVPFSETLVHPQKLGMGAATATGNGFTFTFVESCCEHVPVVPNTVNVVVVAGETFCDACVESANAYAGLAVHAYVVAPVALSVTDCPVQMVKGPFIVILNPGEMENDVESVSTHPVTPSVTITVKLYVAGTPDGYVAVMDDESILDEVIYV